MGGGSGEVLEFDCAFFGVSLDMDTAGDGSAPARPEPAGWRKAATALHVLRDAGAPVLCTIVASQMQPLWIDLSTERFFWEPPLTELPADPGELTVYSQPIEPGNPPYPWVAWRAMDPLLWQVGRYAFATELADWLGQGDRFALQRWPNLTEIPHSAEEIRMIATLANGSLTAQELGLLTGTGNGAARQVLSMLSLMGAVKVANPPVTPVPTASEQPPASTSARPAVRASAGDRAESFGFFSKLRDRFEGR